MTALSVKRKHPLFKFLHVYKRRESSLHCFQTYYSVVVGQNFLCVRFATFHRALSKDNYRAYQGFRKQSMELLTKNKKFKRLLKNQFSIGH